MTKYKLGRGIPGGAPNQEVGPQHSYTIFFFFEKLNYFHGMTFGTTVILLKHSSPNEKIFVVAILMLKMLHSDNHVYAY